MKRKLQYIVTYRNKETLEWLRRKCNVTYESLVLNVVLLDTDLTEHNLLELGGVMSVKQTRNRLYSNRY